MENRLMIFLFVLATKKAIDDVGVVLWIKKM